MQRNRAASILFIILYIANVCSLNGSNFLHERREGCCDVDVLFGADLHESPALLTGELCAHFRGNHFVGLVHFVAQEHDDRILGTVVFYLLRPRLQRQERVFVGDVVNQDGSDRATVKDWCDGFEPLLAQSVPNVQLNDLLRPRNQYVFAFKFDLGRREVILVERAVCVSIGNAGLADHFVSHQDDLPLVVRLIVGLLYHQFSN